MRDAVIAEYICIFSASLFCFLFFYPFAIYLNINLCARTSSPSAESFRASPIHTSPKAGHSTPDECVKECQGSYLLEESINIRSEVYVCHRRGILTAAQWGDRLLVLAPSLVAKLLILPQGMAGEVVHVEGDLSATLGTLTGRCRTKGPQVLASRYKSVQTRTS